ncbi:MAG: hypothetical protein J5641_05520, partial [Bacteroidales bacterium]|nr:hypothetical protein [Bacteroidales bacterium]
MSTNRNSSKKRKPKKKVRPTGRLKEFWMTQRCRRLRGACYVLLSLFLLVATISFFFCRPNENWVGKVGYKLSQMIVQNTFGVASLGFYLLLFIYGLRLWKVHLLPWKKTFWSTLFWMVWVSSVLGYCAGVWGKGNYVMGNLCGVTGDFIASQLYMLIKWGALVLFAFLAVVFLIFVHRVRFRMPKVDLPKVDLTPAIDSMKSTVGGIFTHDSHEETEDSHEVPDSAQKKDPQPEKVTFSIDDEFSRINHQAGQSGQISAQPPSEVAFNINDTMSESQPEEEPALYSEFENVHTEAHYTIDQLYDPHLDLKQYEMPTTDLLTDWETRNVKVSKEELVANKDHIVETLRNYGIEIVEITASPGPTVTLYEIKPAPGVRISKIKNLEDDIALSLSALGIRIIAPIPGKGTVGIEVPNAKPQIVSMKNMLECDPFRNSGKMELPIAFGKTISNDPYVADLAKMPHLLMAGATGTGKSVGLNAVITSLLFKKHPSELKFVMVDPKKVE